MEIDIPLSNTIPLSVSLTWQLRLHHSWQNQYGTFLLTQANTYSHTSLNSIPPSPSLIPFLHSTGSKTPHNVLASQWIWRACSSLCHTSGGSEERSWPNWPCPPNGEYRLHLPRGLPSLPPRWHQLQEYLSPAISKPSGLPPNYCSLATQTCIKLWYISIVVAPLFTYGFCKILHRLCCMLCVHIIQCVEVCHNSLCGFCKILHLCCVVTHKLMNLKL